MGRREDNKRQKREALLAAGLRLFLEQGVAGASVEQIASAAGVARGTFYLYFETKEGLFDAVIDRFLDPLMAVFDDVEASLAAAEGPEATLRVYQVMAARLAVVGLGHRDTVMLLFREMRGQAVPSLRAREVALIGRITALTRLAMDRGLVRAGDPRLASLVILGGIERLYFEVLLGELELGDPSVLAVQASVVLSRVLGLDVG